MVNLTDIDRLQIEIASMIHQAAPKLWDKAVVYARISPDGGIATLIAEHIMKDGSLNRRHGIVGEPASRMDDLAERHWKLVQELGQPTWFQMILTVEETGEYHFDFQYNENYDAEKDMRGRYWSPQKRGYSDWAWENPEGRE